MTEDIAVVEGPVQPGLEPVPEAGAVVRFEGRVRGEEAGRPIRALIYEAYEPMASRQMAQIVRALGDKFPCLAVRIRHRVGTVPVGEIAIVVEAVAAHRGEAFALVSAFMDRLKQDVPIWKMRALPLEP
jgi:molybdopterin synthase catalytic subunit